MKTMSSRDLLIGIIIAIVVVSSALLDVITGIPIMLAVIIMACFAFIIYKIKKVKETND